MSHPKRRHHSDRLSSSSDVSDTEPSLALHHRRKRRLISSDEEAPSSCDGMFGFRAQTKKRRHDDVYSEEEEDLQPNPSFPADHHPPTKRLRKGLSDGFTRLGIREGAEPETRRQTMPTEPSSVVVPGEGEVGPAVWLRHADSVVEEEQEEGERVKYVVVGEDGEEQELSGKEVALWTGNKRAAVKGDSDEIYIPSYLSSAHPSNRVLSAPDDAWTNRERGLVLYTPQQPMPYSSTPPIITELDSAPSSPMDTSVPTPILEEPPQQWGNPNFGFASYGEGTFIEEVEGGGMDLD